MDTDVMSSLSGQSLLLWDDLKSSDPAVIKHGVLENTRVTIDLYSSVIYIILLKPPFRSRISQLATDLE